MGRRIGAVDPTMDRWKAALDPTTQWTGGKLHWILIPSGPVYMCRGSNYPMDRRKAALDTTNQWAGGFVDPTTQ